MKVTSKEITYRSVVEQVFFEDDSELIIKCGWPEGQPFDMDTEIEWAIGSAPQWAESLSKEQLINLVGKGESE
jgi:hypothetical protein